MPYKVKLPRTISAAIGGCGLSRPAVVRLLIRVRERLEDEQTADKFASTRSPTSADCFRFRVVLDDGGFYHTCSFLVNDTREPGTLHIEGFAHTSRTP